MRSVTSAAAALRRGRLLLRLAPATLVAVGALACAHHLGSTPGPAAPAVFAAAATPRSVEPAPVKRVGYDPRVTAPDSQTALIAAEPRSPEPVAPEKPATFDPAHPAAGGLVAAGPIARAVGGGRALGPLHVDPVPAGASLTAPTDTASLYARSGAVPLTPAQLQVASATPAGTPSTPGLTAHVTPSCSGTGTDGKRVQAMYVHEASQPSRYSAVLSVLRNEVANVDDVYAVSSRKTGGDLRVRWVHDAQCRPVIPDVTVPDGTLSGFGSQITAVQALGYTAKDRKYVMFTDANAYCGIGTLYLNDSPTANPNDGYSASYSRIDANCWSTAESVAAHELTHNLGGVQRSAPHATTNGHCYDESDLMCYDDGSGIAMRSVCASSQSDLLDCNNDDYFNTHPAAGSYLATHWNTARSSFLDDVSGPATAPTVTVTSAQPTAETGDAIAFTATSGSTVGWTWTSSQPACTIAAGTTATPTLTCASTVAGVVTVTATGTDAASGLTGTGSASVLITPAAAPTSTLTVPALAAAGTPYAVSATPAGKAPFGFTWSVTGPCRLSSPTAASPEVLCSGAGEADVSVVVRQNDGQTVTAGPSATTVAATDTGAGAAAGTAWSVVRQSARAPVRLGATLTDVFSGQPLAGQPVALEVRWRGTSTWVSAVGGLVTDGSGRVVAAPPVGKAGWFRFAFAGTTEQAAASSGEHYLKVSTRIRMSIDPRRHRVDGRLTTSTGAGVVDARLRLERRTAGSSSWHPVTRAVTGARGWAHVRVAPHRATYYRWTFGGEVVHRDALSQRVLFRT